MEKRTVYTKDALREISFPMGGIGTGCIGLAGNVGLVDWEIFNRPNKGGDNGFSHFAVKASRTGETLDARVLVGDVTKDLAGAYGHGCGSGLTACSMQGFPHFRTCVFTGEFPVATVEFVDDSFPGKATLTGWNPLIPLNDHDSGIPEDRGRFLEDRGRFLVFYTVEPLPLTARGRFPFCADKENG